jgi:hypothetical protein
MRLGGILAVVWAATASVHAAAQAGAEQRHVRGIIVNQPGDVLEVETGPGRTERLSLPPDATVSEVEAGDRASLAQGAYVGTTAVPQPDGTLRALEVHVFPDSMRGAGEGHRLWDLAPRSSMTNATVSGTSSAPAGQSSVTNATVSGVGTAGGMRTLTLQYPGGKQTVVVPREVPVVKIETGDPSMLLFGVHVFAIATRQPDGKLVAHQLVVGEGGMVPPM